MYIRLKSYWHTKRYYKNSRWSTCTEKELNTDTVWLDDQLNGLFCIFDDISEYLKMTENLHMEKVK